MQTRPATDTGYLPFSLPSVPTPSGGPRDPAATPAAEDDGSKFQQQGVVSRFSLSEQKRQEKERWEKEQREKEAISARQAKLQEKKVLTFFLGGGGRKLLIIIALKQRY